jgi:hypothetical protein
MRLYGSNRNGVDVLMVKVRMHEPARTFFGIRSARLSRFSAKNARLSRAFINLMRMHKTFTSLEAAFVSKRAWDLIRICIKYSIC